jgi:autotransporter-associated beta strand protein
LRNASSNTASFAGNIITAGTTNTVGVDGSGDMLLSGSISGDSGLLKLGTGTLTLTGSNTYSGTTTVSNGTLLVNGVIVGNGVAVSTNASLGGSGTIGGNVTLSSGALALFTNGSTLTIFGSLTANANVVQLHLPANVPTNTYLLATYNPTGSSGSLASTPAVLSGSFAAGTTNYINTAGGQVNLVVETLVTTPAVTNITYSVSGGQLVLDWPDGQGWQLQAQTNSLNSGVTTHWFSVPGATPPYTNAIDPANPAVFYRLSYP